MSPIVRLTIQDQIAHVQFDRAEKHNALSLELFKAIGSVQAKLRRNRDIRVVVVSGAGVDFCTGLDLKSMLGAPLSMAKIGWKLWPGASNLAQKTGTGWSTIPAPVIAAVQGRCWGGGLQIALGADFRIAHPDASLSILEGKWGLIPDLGGTQAFRALLRRDQLLKLAMTAEMVDGNAALELGIVTEVDDEPLVRAMALAKELCGRSPDALAAAKKLYYDNWTGPAWLALARETWYQVRLMAGKNQRVAVIRGKGGEASYVNRRCW
jgi:enoyl-CoA hydratase/carnithine racemase